MKPQIVLIGADQVIDGIGDLTETDRILCGSNRIGTKFLEIVPLATGWNQPLARDEFRSGASAFEALTKAWSLLKAGTHELIVIQGKDNLISDYDPGKRQELMKILQEKIVPLEAYDQLTEMFLKNEKIDHKTYVSLCEELLLNYHKTFQRKHNRSIEVAKKWTDYIKPNLRGVDCANPNIDYRARIIVTTDSRARELGVPAHKQTLVQGVAFKKIGDDSLSDVNEISRYEHLKDVFQEVTSQAGIDFRDEFLKQNAYLDVYTCFPVVPLAFLLKNEFCSITGMKEFLSQHQITTFGGLNLARAPWNLTGLRSLIEMRNVLMNSGDKKMGLVHANGGLGQYQGMGILKKIPN